jgi:hypothetical protein
VEERQMTRRHFGGCLVITLVALGSVRGASADKYPKLAPYTAVRWDGDRAEVEVDGRFYLWHAIDDVTVERLVDFAKKAYGDRWRKRVSEDLVQVMTELGRAPGAKVTLRLAAVESKQEFVRSEPMTHENRQKVWRANQTAGM